MFDSWAAMRDSWRSCLAPYGCAGSASETAAEAELPQRMARVRVLVPLEIDRSPEALRAAGNDLVELAARPSSAFGEAMTVTLDALPDDALQQVIGACSDTAEFSVPLFEAVKSLACLSKALLQQLHRLRPPVGVQSLAVVQRVERVERIRNAVHGPWRVTLLYEGELTAAVVEQAQQG